MTENYMFKKAKDLLEKADVLIITAGAGMGVDSGLPDFRGNEGFWKAYPALKSKKIDFEAIANPKQFTKHPGLAWAFYGHRFDLYKKTIPHNGYLALKALAEKKDDYFVVTSNVDGQFQKAGFDPNNIYEVHGRINKFQCTDCNAKTWSPDENLRFDVNPKTLEFKGEIPKCERCGSVARPNIMMFGDYLFNEVETDAQMKRFNSMINNAVTAKKIIAIIEIGAGTTIPTIRMIGENIQERVENAHLIRINPAEDFGPKGTISVKQGAVSALKEIMPEDIKKIFLLENQQ